MDRIDDHDGSRGPDWKHDVFVSFRGDELRDNFASHFFKAMKKAGIDCFRDDDEHETGEKIRPKLVHAIRRSRFSLALFSKRYGESRWCLNELVEMLDFHEKNKHCGHVFMPIFYKVRAGDVRKLTGKFGKCFEEYCKKICADDSEIETWKRALIEAGSTSGWRLSGRNEAEFIDTIVDHLLNNILLTSSPYVPEDVFGIESQAEEVMSLLEMDPGQCESPARMIGIRGNRGMGKTTLAGMVFNRICYKFEGVSFLQLDDEANRDNHIHLQRKLLQDAFKIDSRQFHDLRSNANEIKRKLRSRKLLLVLDNVTSKDQVRHFGLDDRGRWLSWGSRVIITTRNGPMLDELCVDDKYEVKKMCRSASLRLFSRRVFGSDHPEEGFEELCESILDICNVRPSDLVDLASVLCGMVKERWLEGIEKWKKKRKVFSRDLVERVISKRPIPHSYDRGFDVAYPVDDLGRTAFLSNSIRDFLNNVSHPRNGFATLLIGRPEGQIFMIPLPNLERNDWEDRITEKTERRNERSNNMRAWISLLRRMGIVEPRREAACVTWGRTSEASTSRFTEYAGAQANIPEPSQNSLRFQEEEPVTDPTLQSENVHNEAAPPETKSVSTLAVNRENIPKGNPLDEAAVPSSNHGQQIRTQEDKGELPEDFPPARSYSGPFLSFLLSQISQAGFQIGLGFENRVPESPITATSHPQRKTQAYSGSPINSSAASDRDPYITRGETFLVSEAKGSRVSSF